MTIVAQWFTTGQVFDPLDFIRSEQDRQLLVSDHLVELANNQQFELVLQEAETLLAYLTEDLPLHRKDEEDDLFRMLRLRCRPEDGIDSILVQLEQDHAVERFMALNIALDLKAIVGGRTLQRSMQLFINLRTFAKSQRRHIAWKNGVVLPLASYCQKLVTVVSGGAFG